ncbi:MAG TPA: monooxygenase [Gammaproteobacteria bacterium]|jgi:NAD(P)H-dependent flavin oxidoreductase YrpB (nitropropane dioxygenase family)|nr:monooxygenase [Gammaproteobacteria bacterium]
MKSKANDLLGCEFPLFAFSHCRDVIAEVSNAGGFGVLGAAGHTPESLDIELTWLDEHTDKPYGVDLLVPTSMDSKQEGLTAIELEERIPPEHKRYIEGLLAQHDIDTKDLWQEVIRDGVGDNMREHGATQILESAFAHSGVRMVVNALGVPPDFMMEMARQRGVIVGALAGAKEHAVKHAEAGIDVIIVAGTEAGGHCGEVSTMVLVPEVIDALAPYKKPVILAAGGIVTGRQMAATMAMGADGVWTGSVWLTTAEAETLPVVKEKMLVANSRQTVRSKSRTGKYTRQLRSAWTDAWTAEESPEPLPMPLQGVVAAAAFRKIDKLAQADHAGAKQLANYFVGQGVGLMNETISARTVVYNFMEDFASATERLTEAVTE